MSKGSKRRSWRTIERDFKAVAPPAPTREPVMTCALPPPPLTRREAEKERLRQIARETLAAEQEMGIDAL